MPLTPPSVFSMNITFPVIPAAVGRFTVIAPPPASAAIKESVSAAVTVAVIEGEALASSNRRVQAHNKEV